MRKKASSELCVKRKTELGQFMTSASVSHFMASLFPDYLNDRIYLLDPGAGVGCLTTAFLSRVKNWESVKNIDVDAYEIDEIMLQYLNNTLNSNRAEGSFANRRLNLRVIDQDFVQSAAEDIFMSDGLWNKMEESNTNSKYTHCIMNPPYRKIKSSSLHRKLLRSVGIETVNLYSGFVALSLSLLQDSGYLVAIIPRSFCNGSYYRPFRELILNNSAIKHIHLFGSRKKTFKDDNVLQENVIIMLQKKVPQKEVIVTTSTDDSFIDLRTEVFDFENIVIPEDKERFIHIPVKEGEKREIGNDRFSYTLDDLDIQVSTGPVVDFRLKSFLRWEISADTVPLLYPCHFSEMKSIRYKSSSKKPIAIIKNSETMKWLYPKGNYAVVRRFSSKEEKRRIVASVVDFEDFNAEFIGFENHLNVFHKRKMGLPLHLAWGLVVYLNSSFVDDGFRRFSGHTQVNVTDLKMLRYPSIDSLIYLGKWAYQQDKLTSEKIDLQLEKMIKGDYNAASTH
jgi:adenine-specific DNA-methyltransferase